MLGVSEVWGARLQIRALRAEAVLKGWCALPGSHPDGTCVGIGSGGGAPGAVFIAAEALQWGETQKVWVSPSAAVTFCPDGAP